MANVGRRDLIFLSQTIWQLGSFLILINRLLLLKLFWAVCARLLRPFKKNTHTHTINITLASELILIGIKMKTNQGKKINYLR